MLTKKVNKLVVAPIIFTLILTIGITYAWFTKNVNTNDRTITLQTPDKFIGIYGDNKNNIELNKEYTFTIENRTSLKARYELYLESITDIDLSTISYSITGAIITSGNLGEGNLIMSALNEKQSVTIKLTLTSSSADNFTAKIRIKTLELIDASEVEYINSNYTNCNNVECTLKEIDNILS